MQKKKVTISLDSKTYESFKKYCEDNAVMLSKRIELFMKEILKSKATMIVFFMIFAMSLASAASIYSEGFESGGLSGWSLSNSGGVNFQAVTTDPYQGFYHTQSNAPGTSEPGSVMSKIISTSGYSSINFSYYRKLVGLDSADEFQAKWFDGTTWTIIEQTGSNSANDAGYIVKSFLLPAGASNNINFAIKFECTAGAVTEFCRIDNVNITGTINDNTPAIFSSYTETPVNSTAYSQNVLYQFNVTITESNINKYGIEFNGTNYTNSDITVLGNGYSFNISDLSAGTYYYYWWANDTNNNYNTTGLRYFTVSKAAPSVFLFLNNNTDNLIIQYPSQLNASASTSQGALILYKNGIDITSSNNFNQTLASGYYNLTAYSSGNQNYSSASKTYFANITKATPSISLTFSQPSPITYGTLLNASCSSNSQESSVKLYRNHLDATSTNNQLILLGASTYNFVCNLTSSQNYSAVSSSSEFIVNKATTSTILSNSPASPIIYGTLSNFSCFNANLPSVLYINNLNKDSEKSQNILRAAATYSVNCTSYSDENYTGDSKQESYGIIKAQGTVFLLLNSNSDNLTIQYPFQLNASASTNYGATTLYRNSMDITSSNSQNLSLASGYYNLTAYSSGNQNYSSASKTYFANITKAENILTLLLNAVPNNISINYIQSLNASASSLGGTVYLYRNNLLISNSQYIVLAAGSYEFFANSTGNQNYSDNSAGIRLNATINKTSPTSNMLISLTPSSIVNYGTQTSSSASNSNSGDSDLVYSFFRNNLSIANPNTETLASGSYVYEYNTTGGQNYTSGRITSILTVNNLGNPVTLMLNGLASNLTLQYPSQLNASAYSPSSISLFRNSGDITPLNSISRTLAAGSYEFFANSSGNQNYASNSTGEKFFANITKAASSVALYLNNLRENLSATTQDAINITAYKTLGEGNIYLYLDNVLINQELSTAYNSTIIISQGLHNITAVYEESQNYTSSSENFWVNLTEAPDVQGPSITIYFPEAKIYSYNMSLPLNFSIYDLSGVDSCWYSLDEAANISIPNCENLTFNVTEDGYFQLRFYANDTLGNTASETRDFGVITQAPAINILFPRNNSFLSYNSVFFNYTVESAFPMSSCELYSDFNGPWILNTSNLSITQTTNFFFANLDERTYNWMISCNDSEDKRSNVSYGLVIDTTSPILTLSQPSGQKYSRTVSASWEISDTNLESCSYNVYRGVNIEIENTSVTCSSNSTSFSTTLDAEFVFNFYANDSAGNLNLSSLNFSVSTATTPYVPPAAGGGGGGGGSGGGLVTNTTKITSYNLDLSPISSLIVEPGETRKIMLAVKNNGKSFLNKCTLKGKGLLSSWISSEGIYGLSSGEVKEFVLNLAVPKGLSYGAYALEAEIVCDEFSKSSAFNAEIIDKKLVIGLVEVKKESNNQLRVIYTLQDLSGKDQSVELNFALFNLNNEKVIEKKTSQNIASNSKNQFEEIIEVPSNSNSLSLVINANSETASASLKETIVLGNLQLGGFAIFLGEAKSEGVLLGVFILAFLVFAFFMLRRIVHFKKHIKVKNKVLVSFKNDKSNQ